MKNDVWGLTGRHQFTASSWFNEFSLSFQESQWNPQPTDPDLVGFEYEGLLRIGGRDTEQRIGQERLSFRNDTISSLRCSDSGKLLVIWSFPAPISNR